MNLKDYYQKQKGKPSVNDTVTYVLKFISGWVIIAGFLYIGNFLWNFISPKFNLPNLGYVEFVSAVITVRIMRVLLFARLSGNQPTQTVDFNELMELANKDGE